MTDRSVSWTDADSIARLLARATAPRRVATSFAQAKAPVRAAEAAPARVSPSPVVSAGASVRSGDPSPADHAAASVRSGRASTLSGHPSPVVAAGVPGLPLPAAGLAASAQALSAVEQTGLPGRSGHPSPIARASTPARAVVSGPPPQKVGVPTLEQLSDNPSDRLDALLAWTLDHQRCTGAFVADDNGLTLAAHGITEAHVSLVGPLLSALVSVRSIPGIDATAGALWLGANMMSWVEVRTARGGFCLGAVGPEALSTEALQQLKQALAVTVQGL